MPVPAVAALVRAEPPARFAARLGAVAMLIIGSDNAGVAHRIPRIHIFDFIAHY
jgi:hypothetical protein